MTTTNTELPVRAGDELWEITVPGRVWVNTVNARGVSKAISVGGREGARLRIATLDREITQEGVVNPEDDPFLNGMLRRLDADQNADETTKTEHALSTEDLLLVFSQSQAKFRKTVDGMSEINVRRMHDIARDVDASLSQIEYLKEAVNTRWPISSGETPVYKELKAAQQVAGSR